VEFLSDEPDEIIPPPVYDDDNERPDSSSSKLHRASISGKKMTGRPPPSQSNSSTELARKISSLNLSSSEQIDTSSQDSQQTDAKRILTQVAEWLHHEKTKRLKRKTRKKRRHVEKSVAPDEVDNDDEDDDDDASAPDRPTGDSDFDLGSLESILAGYMKTSAGSTPRLLPRSPNILGRKGSLAKKFKPQSLPPQSSDTEFFGDEVLVPNVEADLDNSKTMAYAGGGADTDCSEKSRKKDQKHWDTFKQDILRLTHTLRLKGWRRISIDHGGELDVARLSGKRTDAGPWSRLLI
jgi:choline kinase